MTKVFVSYRREDSMPIVGRLCDRLRAEFGGGNIFVDIDNIPYGADFVEHIELTLKQCHVVLVVIGQHWRGKRMKGKHQLEDANDFVRMELRVALSGSKRILPVLVGGARMPSPEELPEEIRRLSRLNAAPLDIGRDFDRDAEKILLVTREMAAIAGNLDSPDARANNLPLDVGFSLSRGSSDFGYKCPRCGFQAWIHKLEWFRDGERPPAKCPQCGGKGYSE